MELINNLGLHHFFKFGLLIFILSCGGREKNSVQNRDESKVELSTFNVVKTDSLIIDAAETNSRIENPQFTMLNYLKKSFTMTGDSVLIDKPKWMIEENTKNTKCGYILSFREGHTFKYEQECNEWGEIVTVVFHDTSSTSVRKLVNQLYQNKTYNWYSDSTEYRPKEYYETEWTFNVVEKESSTDLVFAYSWI